MWLLSQFSTVFAATSTADIDGLSEIKDTADSVVDLANAIGEHGPLIVALAVFIVLFLAAILLLMCGNIWITKRALNKNDSKDKAEQELITKLIENALNNKTEEFKSIDKSITGKLETIEDAIKRIEDNEPKDVEHKDLVKAYIDVNMAFKDVARSAYKKLGCDRLATYVFHNGNKSLHGLPFFKMSCIHEWTQRGNSTLRGRHHVDMPLHAYSNFVETLYETGIYKSDDINDIAKKDSSMMDFVAFSETRGMYAVAIKGKENELAGFVIAEFDYVEGFEDNEERDKYVRSVIDEMIAYISPIIISGAVHNK